jgi:hypothetical protein
VQARHVGEGRRDVVCVRIACKDGVASKQAGSTQPKAAAVEHTTKFQRTATAAERQQEGHMFSQQQL